MGVPFVGLDSGRNEVFLVMKNILVVSGEVLSLVGIPKILWRGLKTF